MTANKSEFIIEQSGANVNITLLCEIMFFFSRYTKIALGTNLFSASRKKLFKLYLLIRLGSDPWKFAGEVVVVNSQLSSFRGRIFAQSASICSLSLFLQVLMVTTCLQLSLCVFMKKLISVLISPNNNVDSALMNNFRRECSIFSLRRRI